MSRHAVHRTVTALAWLIGLALGSTLGSAPLVAQRSGVAATVHNLSVSGPGEIRSLSETEICKFCHVPHNAIVPKPLWGHALPEGGGYLTPETRAPGGQRVPVPQPDGASRLCLSCHDGTVALGDVAGEKRPLPMRSAQRLGPGRPGFIGTDLSGSHPVSLVVPDGGTGASDDSDMGLRPLAVIRTDAQVKLDSEGKMQCTTCHDPHDDRFYAKGRVPHFWVKGSIEEVCLTCHEPR